MFEERLDRARAARARLLDEIGTLTLTSEGAVRGPYRDTASAPDQELELARAEADVKALEHYLRKLSSRRHRGLRPSGAARLVGWMAVAVMAALGALSLIIAVLSATRRPTPVSISRGTRPYERQLSFTVHREPEACLAIARTVLSRANDAGHPAAVTVTPRSLRAYVWQADADAGSGPPTSQQLRAAAADDYGWRYSVEARPWFGQTRVTLVGRDQTCAVYPQCFAPPTVRCSAVRDPTRLDREMEFLKAYLSALCGSPEARDRERRQFDAALTGRN
jgi:hypothetical protein